MTFQDIFKSSFLENIASISILDMVIALVLAFLLGLFIFFIYKKSYSGVMYSASFGVTLVALSLITTLLIMTVVSNIVLSLGMVGALSIVRFRTAIKEHGYRVPVLGYCGGHCPGGRADSVGGIRQYLYWGCALYILQKENGGFPLYPGGTL